MLKLIVPLILSLLLLTVENSRADTIEITASDVYAQALRIEQETLELKRQLGIKQTPETPKVIKTDVLARHIWAKTYVLLTKMTAFREQKKLPAIQPVSIEPQLNLLWYSNWAQCLRILTEMKIIEQALGVNIPTVPVSVVTNKRPVDVFNKLNQITAIWQVLIGGQITPTYVYAEAMRLNEDVSSILQMKNVMDTAEPPAKPSNATPGDSLNAGFAVLREIQQLQEKAELEPMNLEEFHLDKQQAKPQDVFTLIELLLAELQPLKVKLGMKHVITPVAQYYENKRPADVTQVLGYITNRLHLLNQR
jgi:hypothetical protein